VSERASEREKGGGGGYPCTAKDRSLVCQHVRESERARERASERYPRTAKGRGPEPRPTSYSFMGFRI
jgi:hypothetical protein